MGKFLCWQLILKDSWIFTGLVCNFCPGAPDRHLRRNECYTTTIYNFNGKVGSFPSNMFQELERDLLQAQLEFLYIPRMLSLIFDLHGATLASTPKMLICATALGSQPRHWVVAWPGLSREKVLGKEPSRHHVAGYQIPRLGFRRSVRIRKGGRPRFSRGAKVLDTVAGTKLRGSPSSWKQLGVISTKHSDLDLGVTGVGNFMDQVFASSHRKSSRLVPIGAFKKFGH